MWYEKVWRFGNECTVKKGTEKRGLEVNVKT